MQVDWKFWFLQNGTEEKSTSKEVSVIEHLAVDSTSGWIQVLQEKNSFHFSRGAHRYPRDEPDGG